MFDLSGLASNTSSRATILLMILGLVFLVVAVATREIARGITTAYLILILIALVLVLEGAKKISTWLKGLILKPDVGPIFPVRG